LRDAECRALFVAQVPGGSNANNYANVQLIVDLCIAQSVDAVFVGWGHASENPKLGEMLIQKTKQLGRKITFVGPTSPVMRVLGDKIGSILLAQAAGVSTMPWNGRMRRATARHAREASRDGASVARRPRAHAPRCRDPG
jgi:biotin carboxylase